MPEIEAKSLKGTRPASDLTKATIQGIVHYIQTNKPKAEISIKVIA